MLDSGIQPGERTGAGCKTISFDAHLLQQTDKQVAQRGIVITFEGEVPTVPKPPPATGSVSCRSCGRWRRRVAAVKHHRLIQQSLAVRVGVPANALRGRAVAHLLQVDLLQLGQFLFDCPWWLRL
jgi:hypothetical protein